VPKFYRPRFNTKSSATEGSFLVFGHINVDFFYDCEKFPKAGETIMAWNLTKDFGGKAANQAVA
jgi:ribokinase